MSGGRTIPRTSAASRKRWRRQPWPFGRDRVLPIGDEPPRRAISGQDAVKNGFPADEFDVARGESTASCLTAPEGTVSLTSFFSQFILTSFPLRSWLKRGPIAVRLESIPLQRFLTGNRRSRASTWGAAAFLAPICGVAHEAVQTG
jgi:hypothetical protein